jgi:hypothetical protein
MTRLASYQPGQAAKIVPFPQISGNSAFNRQMVLFSAKEQGGVG